MPKWVKMSLLALGVLLFLFAVIILLFESFNYGVIVFFAVSCILIVYGLFGKRLIRIKWLTYGVIALCALYLAMMLFIGFYGRNDNVTNNTKIYIIKQ